MAPVSLRRSGTKRGFGYDDQRGAGGDLLHLIARERNVRLGEAVSIALHDFLATGDIAYPSVPPIDLHPRVMKTTRSVLKPLSSNLVQIGADRLHARGMLFRRASQA